MKILYSLFPLISTGKRVKPHPMRHAYLQKVTVTCQVTVTSTFFLLFHFSLLIT
jgi:hypothetical protein